MHVFGWRGKAQRRERCLRRKATVENYPWNVQSQGGEKGGHNEDKEQVGVRSKERRTERGCAQ